MAMFTWVFADIIITCLEIGCFVELISLSLKEHQQVYMNNASYELLFM